MDRQKVLVIGASSGIGRALAELLIAKGYVVGITARREEVLATMARAYLDRYRYRALDVTDVATVPMQLTELASAMGGIDTLVMSAGGGDVNRSVDFKKEHQMIELNVAAFTCVADWAFNYFKQQG